MRTVTKQVVKSLFESLGYRVTRLGTMNRFQADAETLRMLRDRGYRPRVIIDGGANVGNWTRMVRKIFPSAAIHMIEPQAGCAEPLQSLAKSMPDVTFYPFAITVPDVESVLMAGGGPNGRGSGCYVSKTTQNGQDLQKISARTLDSLVADHVVPNDRALLKLDIQGHELDALAGAEQLMRSVEVIFTELSFYPIDGQNRPVCLDYAVFLRERGFELLDIANLSGRASDRRLREGDFVFVKKTSPLYLELDWE